MTKETPITLDQLTVKALEILETDLVAKQNLTRLRDETDTSRLRIRLPAYTPPSPKPPYMALAAMFLVALGVFIGVWLACAVAFLL